MSMFALEASKKVGPICLKEAKPQGLSGERNG